jgi:hypothetical protein
MPPTIRDDPNSFDPEEDLGPGTTMDSTECQHAGGHATADEHTRAHMADLETAGMLNRRIPTPEEAEEAWRTHPDRRVNGGEFTDAEVLGRMGAY